MNKEKIEQCIEYIRENIDQIDAIALFEKGKYEDGDVAQITPYYNIEVKKKQFKIKVI